MADMIGTTLGHFRIISKLSESRSGEVYRAEDEALRRHVVLKILSPTLASDPDHKARFINAARAAALVTHPHVAAVHEVGESEGRVWVAMELVEGATLRSRLTGRPLPLLETLRIGEQVAEGLAAAHEKSLAHGDLSPEKVVLGPGGQVKVVDLGLGDETYDTRTDVYRLGTMLYEMATGRPPESASSADGLSTAATIPPSALNPEIPAELDRIIGACLEPDPEDRYQHTGQVAVDLGKLRRRTGSAPVAVPSGEAAVDPYAQRRRSHRWLWTAAMLALATAVGLAGWQRVWPRLKPAPPFKAGDRYIVTDFVNETSDIELGLALQHALDSRLAGQVTLQRVRRDAWKEAAALYRAEAEARCLKGECEAYLTGKIAGDPEHYRLEIAVYRARRADPIVALSTDTDAKGIGNALYGMIRETGQILHRKSGIGTRSTGTECVLWSGDVNALRAALHRDRGNELATTAPEQALVAGKRAMILDPGDPRNTWLVGWILFNVLGRRREAVPYLKEALQGWSAAAEKHPECRAAELTQEIWFLDWTWNYDLLAERVNRGLQLFPNSGVIWIKYAKITERMMGDPVAGLPHYRKMYELLRPISLDIYLDALLRAGALDELDAAIADRRRDAERIDQGYGDNGAVSTAFTDLVVTEAQIAAAHVRGEEYGTILERIERAVKEGRLSEEAARGLRADYLTRAGRLAEAEQWAREAQKGEVTTAAMSGLMPGIGYGLLDWLEKRRTGRVRDLETAEQDGCLQSDDSLINLARMSVDLGTGRALHFVLRTVEEEQRDNRSRRVLEAIKFSRGCRALIEGRGAEAVELLEPLGRDYGSGSHLHPQHVLGRAYEAAGRWADAAKAHEAVCDQRRITATLGVVEVLDQHRLAGIYERLGNTERARYWYGRFLKDWRNADPGTPEVEDAKRRIAALGGPLPAGTVVTPPPATPPGPSR